MSQKLVILSAPSGAGKTTVAHHLMQSDLNLAFSISACSRAKRAKETDGIDYYFLDAWEFRQRIVNGDFLEWEEVYPDHYYGTLKAEVQRLLREGKNVLFDVDVKGGLNVKKFYGSQALSIFIMPPSIEVLHERLLKRSSDGPELIRMRIEKASEEIAFAPQFDQILINHDLDQTLHDAYTMVKAFLDADSE